MHVRRSNSQPSTHNREQQRAHPETENVQVSRSHIVGDLNGQWVQRLTMTWLRYGSWHELQHNPGSMFGQRRIHTPSFGPKPGLLACRVGKECRRNARSKLEKHPTNDRPVKAKSHGRGGIKFRGLSWLVKSIRSRASGYFLESQLHCLA